MSTASRLAKLAEGLDSNGVLSADKGGTGATSLAAVVTSATPAGVSDQANTSTGYFDLPAGTTGQRPATANTGMVRYNSTLSIVETYNGTSWTGLGGGAATVSATAPASPTEGSFWLNNETGDLSIYAGGAWILAGGGGGSSTPADGSITAVMLNLGTGYLPIPVGTQAQRPGAPSAGHTRINSDTGYVEVYYNSIWNNTSINFSIGQAATNPGTSAAQIKSLTGTTTDGFYWINLPTVGPTQVYCDMNTSGGGWMLAAKVYSDTSKFNLYTSADWTTISTFNAGQTPAFAGHIKTDVYNYWVPTTGQRLCAGAVTNNLYENWTGFTMVALLNATSQNSQNSRAQWLAWCAAAPGGIAASNFDNQPNCNQAGTNKNYAGFNARIGISLNNEGDCSSNDSSLGFGGNFGPCGWVTWNPTTTGLMVGWIWVK